MRPERQNNYNNILNEAPFILWNMTMTIPIRKSDMRRKMSTVLVLSKTIGLAALPMTD